LIYKFVWRLKCGRVVYLSVNALAAERGLCSLFACRIFVRPRRFVLPVVVLVGFEEASKNSAVVSGYDTRELVLLLRLSLYRGATEI
jgi:hypothetical protein